MIFMFIMFAAPFHPACPPPWAAVLNVFSFLNLKAGNVKQLPQMGAYVSKQSRIKTEESRKLEASESFLKRPEPQQGSWT